MKSLHNKSMMTRLVRIEKGKPLKKRSEGRSLRKKPLRHIHRVTRAIQTLLTNQMMTNLKVILRSLKVIPRNLKANLRNLRVKRSPKKRPSQTVRRKLRKLKKVLQRMKNLRRLGQKYLRESLSRDKISQKRHRRPWLEATQGQGVRKQQNLITHIGHRMFPHASL